MGRAVERAGPGPAGSAGLLVLGMHRSGTTALARLLAEGGFNPGTRVIGGSTGNVAGHWEDAYAVDLHERMLAELGAAWDEPAAIPPQWATSGAAQRAREGIRAYLTNDRARHPTWVLKDPRASLFASLWFDEARSAGIPVGAVLMLRHPMEVAASLAARDGLSLERGLWLWLEYTAAAARHASVVPNMVIGYDQLLADWRGCAALLRQLPGGEVLAQHGQDEQVERWLDPGLRHHAGVQSPLPGSLDDIWRALSARIGKPLEATAVEDLFGAYHSMQDLLQPVAADWRWRHRQLWQRTARAEDLVSRNALKDRDALAQLQDLVIAQRRDVIDVFSSDIQAMQAETQQAIRAHAEVAGENSELRRASDSLRMALSAARDDLASMRGRASRLGEQLSTADERLRSAGLEHERLEQVNVALSQKGVALGAELDGLREGYGRLQQEHRALAAHAATMEADMGKLRDSQFQLGVRNRELAEAAETLGQVLQSRSWRWSRPFRVAMRLLSGRWGSEDRKKLRALFAGRAGGGTLEVPTNPIALDPAAGPSAIEEAAQALTRQVPLAEPGGQADVFVWAVIDWHFRTQRPQHLARAMSKQGHRVFYISNNFEDAASPGFRVEPLDAAGRLFQVHLHLAGRPAIYFGMPDEAQLLKLRASFSCLLAWTRTRVSRSIVQHPFWKTLAMSCPDARVVYDCMDHHAGFENNAREILRNESDLIAQADLVVVTSEDLKQRIGNEARNLAIVRNGCDFDFFSTAPARTYRQSEGRQVIGYFGAIAEWFDPELVRAVARANPSAEVLLVGSDTRGCGALLAGEANVRLVGEVPYVDLPYWLHGFDVCILPFLVVPLTLATNPVKVYEYLAAGKPVVAVDLPEMAQFGDLVRTAKDSGEFLDAMSKALCESDAGLVRARQAFAATQTWEARADAIDQAITAIEEPLVSVVVLTYNNLTLTQACLASLERYSNYPSLEIIVVDNASSDGSAAWLRGWVDEISSAGHIRRLILNGTNAGFAAGNNIGLAAASGEVLVVLNNDTHVTPGWVRTLCAHFRQHPDLGLLGPVTNNIGNEARIEISYDDMCGMVAAASAYTRARPGQSFPLHNAAFFCVAMPRRVFERVGELDEAFGIGFFEDDDYCRRVEQAGFRVACAEDVFVHHHLSASFEKMPSDERRDLFERNKQTYEAKWGAWTPHAYRRDHA